jgi:hypothetical protein
MCQVSLILPSSSTQQGQKTKWVGKGDNSGIGNSRSLGVLGAMEMLSLLLRVL